MELDHRENAGDRLSLYACLPCRQAKRRCDRTYPQCTLCSQKRIRCDYPSGRKTRQVRRNRKRNSDVSSKSPIDSSITDPASIPISEIRREDEQRIISESAESTVLAERFLDPEVFHRAQLEVQSLDPAFAITNEVSDLVGGLLEIKATAKKFFETVHTWMPIVSKNQFTAKLPNRLAHRRAELYLLVLAMKLCHANVSADKRGLYRAVKQLYFEVELSGILSILVLQSGILIAIYELGQGIYPAAFLSVGCCARYATALGFNNSIISPSSMVRPWDEEEERRRVWWSILVLDR
ncbi:N-terminal binuclear Zn cluster-containing/DNA binding domain-containing protein [Penicillium psychrosexuale]|uniref:N-terminal binuclear Zn cluster-containing/DNA binding domain-containing protein n=1 Tax=Penicillium psychrosexuale TaxID=1002107 RepID=UPI0025459860|nr:N-terminal binuclear Zn cluster-containing/DNA binding domain-containing protein [Penicillium psychrosexuale]KAJ5781970.1 N-terminal binuclear Zn cluster-containing/DNA binding domain-containing protein [Penicillium psychrosexuale]